MNFQETQNNGNAIKNPENMSKNLGKCFWNVLFFPLNLSDS